jgi:hypothetical protein
VLLVGPGAGAELERLASVAQLSVRRITLPEPCSLGAAYNIGLDHAAFDLVLLLHRVVLESDPGVACDYMREYGDVGVTGGKLFKAGPRPRRIWNAGYEVSRGRVAIHAVGRDDWDQFHETRDVDAVSGACMLVRRTDLRFDERYWDRLEDVDFCFQHRQRGFRVSFLPELCGIRLVPTVRKETPADLILDARRLGGQWLYHRRWCSDTALSDHPWQVAVRGEEARQFLLNAVAPVIEQVSRRMEREASFQTDSRSWARNVTRSEAP